MPDIRPEAWQFGLLFLCVPMQYFLVQYWGQTETTRSFALKELLNGLYQFYESHLRWDSWRNWCLDQLSAFIRKSKDKWKYESDLDDPLGESPAVEVMRYKQKEGYFTGSPHPRTFRSSKVLFRVGQVVSHKTWNYRAVIVGWDEEARASKAWLDQMHGKAHPNWREMPNYAVLVDTRDRMVPQVNYIPQDNLQVLKNVKVMHPLIDDFFEEFDGAQYIPRPWLKALYPKD